MQRLQNLLLGVLLLVLAIPIPTIIILESCPTFSKFKIYPWLANKTLEGVTLPQQNVVLSFHSWVDTSFQRSVAKWANENFAGRELAIRGFNQLVWSIFGKSYMYSENIVAGKDNQLLEKQYLLHFNRFRAPIPDENINQLARAMDALNLKLQDHNVPFLVLFTPSKVMSLPDSVPERYQPTKLTRKVLPYDYDRLRASLEDHNVPVIDGATLTRNAKNRLPLPPFPKTGTHWSYLAAYFTAEAVLQKLKLLTQSTIPDLKFSEIQISNRPQYADADLLKLLNLALPTYDQYAYAHVSIQPDNLKRQAGRLVLVGGSFLHTLNSIWEEAEVWTQIDFFYYFTREYFCYPKGSHSSPIKGDSIEWLKTFGTATAVILEINEAAVNDPYIPAFLNAALKSFPEFPHPIAKKK